MIKKIREYAKKILDRDRFVQSHNSSSSLNSKINMQIFTSAAFLMLSVANVIAKSYLMLALTASGCALNIIFAFLAEKYKNVNLCTVSAIATCSVLFGFFVIYGGNDGFASLWVILLPLLAMVSMNFVAGLCASAFFQVFLIVVFWTPVREMLFYRYSDQFCLRFPLFFFVTFILGLMLTISLRKSEYNDYKHLAELEEMTANARIMARTDPLTKLANRRFAYEEFDSKFTDGSRPHCIVMGDIDNFKQLNDTYGHEFGDGVLVILAQYIQELLPQNYLKSRWGGEEFLFAANEPVDEVYSKIEKLREAIADREFDCGGTPVHITITFGIAEYSDRDGLTKAISTADKRLYYGKKTQKNCTVMSDADETETS